MEDVMLTAWVIALIVAVIALACSLVYIMTLRSRLGAISKADHMKQAFLNNINNEIQVPLKAVKDIAAVVAKEDLYLSKNEKRDLSDQLNYHANLIDTLIDEVLMFTGDGSGGHRIHIESFSPNALCRRCLEANMNSIYHRKAVKLNFKRELNDEYFMKSDRHLVELIVSKLIRNACRFTEEGEILVGCNKSENVGQLTFFVEDTGEGIPENRRNNLFTWFEAPDDMNDEAELDLSICYRIAQHLGGTLYMDDHYSRRGTRFVFMLPVL